MAGDMRDTFSETRISLDRSLDTVNLSPEQRKVVLTAIRFGYAAAFCSRTCDMNSSMFSAQDYYNKYKQMISKLEE